MSNSEEVLWERFLASGRSDLVLRNELVERHLPLARAVARDYSNTPGDHDDLFQEAATALVEAASRFDPDRGAKFTTFAYRCMMGRVLDWLRKRGRIARTLREYQCDCGVARLVGTGEGGNGRVFEQDDDLVPELKSLLEALAPTSRAIMELRFCGGLTPKKTGGLVGLSEPRTAAMIRHTPRLLRVRMSGGGGRL